MISSENRYPLFRIMLCRQRSGFFRSENRSGSSPIEGCSIGASTGVMMRAVGRSPIPGSFGTSRCEVAPRQRAMLDFAMKVSQAANTVSEAEFAAVAGHGFTDDDIWDIAAIAAFFALSNRLANVTAMRPNDEFYMLGRLPK